MNRFSNAWSALKGEPPPPIEPAHSEIERASTPPVYFFPGREQRLGITERISPAQLMHAVRGWAAIAVNAIADEGMSLHPYVAVQRMRDNGVIQEERLDEHPLAKLLKNPSPNFSMRALLRLLFSWVPQVGDSYLLKVTDGTGVTRQLEPLNPKDIELIPGRYGIETYLYRSPHTGEEFRYSPQEIVRIYTPDPECAFKGLGKLSPQDLSYDASLFLDQTIRKYFKDDASPKLAIKYPADSELPSEEDLKRWYVDWTNQYNRRQGDRSGVPSTLPPGADLHEFQLWSGKDWVPILDHYRDKLLSAYGVPGSVVGLVQDVNRAAAEANRFTFEATTIKPLADLIADALTNQLARDFDPRLVVRFEDFITVDKNFELEKSKSLLAAKVVTINEVRLREGLSPTQWGELPVGNGQEVPYDGTKPEPQATPAAEPTQDTKPRDAAEE